MSSPPPGGASCASEPEAHVTFWAGDVRGVWSGADARVGRAISKQSAARERPDVRALTLPLYISCA